MRIGMILGSRFPPDIRLEKEMETLRTAHDVVLLCVRRENQSSTEKWQGIEIRRVFSPLQRLWSKWLLLASCHSHAWERAIETFVGDERPDVLHVHDLPLLGPAKTIAARSGIPLVADLHENYPAMLAEDAKIPLSRTSSFGSLASRLTVSIARWKAYERRIVPQADYVIAVIEEARDRLIEIGVDPGNIHVISNYASLDPLPDQTAAPDESSFRIVYAGGFGATRDLYTVVAAIGELPAMRYPGLEVMLIGGKGREFQKLRAYASSIGVSDRVSILEWLPREEAERLMSGAKVGLVPHVKSPHTDATIPHKIFQYMWRKLPVIVSDCAPLERIVEQSGSGLAYPTGDAAALARCIAKLYDNPEMANRMGAEGHAAVASRYNWDRAGASLLRLYETIGAKH